MDEIPRPFESVDDLLRANRVTRRDGQSISTRLEFHGAVRVGVDGAYLIAILNDYEYPGPYHSALSPGLYKVVSLRDSNANHYGYGNLASCIFREDATAVHWQQPPSDFGADNRVVFLIVPDALARWASLVEQEMARNRQKEKGILTMNDFLVWNNTIDIYEEIGTSGPFWNELGLRFNDPAGGDGVGFPMEISAYLHWGLDASGSRVAMMCAWEPINGAGVPT